MNGSRIRRGVVGVALAVAMASLAVGTAPRAVRAQTPGSAPTIATLRGSPARGAIDAGTVALRAGVVVVRARHNGTGFFAVDLRIRVPGGDLERDYETNVNVINSGGRYDGGAAELLQRDAEYTVVVYADGPFEVRLEQPSQTNVTPVDAREFSGEREQVTPIVALPAGTYTVRGSSQGTGRFFVTMYEVDDLGGGIVASPDGPRLFQVGNGPTEVSIEITLRRPGLFFFAVDAESSATAPVVPTWLMRVE